MLHAESVTRRFGNVTAIHSLSLNIQPGELFCLLGANGAGKTTTINLFLGFLAPDEGTVSVGGIEPSVDPVGARKQLAFISENVAIYPQLTGLENVRLFCAMGGSMHSDLELTQLLERAGLSREQMHRQVHGYSKGMRQKVGLAIAYARGAGALLLDEPLSGLDPSAANDFCAELDKLRAGGACILMTTHDLFRAKELAGTIGIMRGGRLVEQVDAQAIDAHDLERLYLSHMRHADRDVGATP